MRTDDDAIITGAYLAKSMGGLHYRYLASYRKAVAKGSCTVVPLSCAPARKFMWTSSGYVRGDLVERLGRQILLHSC